MLTSFELYPHWVPLNDVHVRRPVSFTMYTVTKSTVKTLVHTTSVDS